MDPHQAPISATPTSSRKRSRENETESQRNKREKAAERQRRKRERDRQAGLNNLLSMSQVQQPPPPPVEEQPVPVPEPQFAPQEKGEELSPDEAARREKVRAAARERQRKHRALVKQKKLRELGLDMGNELLPGIEDVQYRLNADGQYQPIMHDLQQHPHAPHPHMHEPPFPQGQPLGGQTFASTLLLSFSCAPLLKAHLLRTLNMSNEELASLEPIIAQAWDHWDQQRRMHYAQQNAAAAAANANKPPDGGHVPDGSVSQYTAMTAHAVNQAINAVNHQQYVHEPPPPAQGSPNDFRARFHRPLVAPSPFRMGADQQQAMANSASAATLAAAAAAAAAAAGPSQGADQMDPNSNLDPQLGQARDEAVGVAKQLERS
ncbi:hypothetical protein PsYK624_152010 [Phanerochaete sordida]|uniref:Uncharacterized protein n=1 Tax=Phanerochaete sordida TaxID=48140 RepID=A0A9P3GPZ6_9APHY|nr:hypothetical protein PsYK624_152010 [Phanerochaete sordida]